LVLIREEIKEIISGRKRDYKLKSINASNQVETSLAI